MSSTYSEQRKKRLLITLTAAGLVLLTLAGFGIYGLITGPHGQHPDQTRTEQLTTTGHGGPNR